LCWGLPPAQARVYAAGFGVVEERAEDAQVNLVLTNQAGAAPGVVPDPLQTIEAQAEDIIDVVPGSVLVASSNTRKPCSLHAAYWA
jgi:hypothetical protein